MITEEWKGKPKSDRSFQHLFLTRAWFPKKYLIPEKDRQPNRKIGKAWTGTSQNRLSKITQKNYDKVLILIRGKKSNLVKNVKHKLINRGNENHNGIPLYVHHAGQDEKSWWRCGVAGTPAHCWWESKSICALQKPRAVVWKVKVCVV